jgi:hypothetical protein
VAKLRYFEMKATNKNLVHDEITSRSTWAMLATIQLPKTVKIKIK